MEIEKDGKLNSEGRLDILYELASNYRKSETYLNVLRFCNKMKHLNPYNTMLAHIQMPGAYYLLSVKEWKQYGRILKPNARPLVILNFKPVGFVYDISSTMPDPECGIQHTEEEIIKEIETQNSVYSMNDNCIDMNTLYRNLHINGIAIDENMYAAVDYSARIELLNYSIETTFNTTKDKKVTYNLPYLISVNCHASKGEKINSIFHELGHLFCCHIKFPSNWRVAKKGYPKDNADTDPWEVRNISHEAKEIEAESVACIVCARLGIVTKSERYLSHFIGSSKTIPEDVDYETVYSAATKLYKFASRINYKKGLLYKFDQTFARYSQD